MNPCVGRAMTLITQITLVVIAVLWGHGQAWAPTAVEDVRGPWHGFFLSDQTGQVMPVELNVTSERIDASAARGPCPLTT